MNRYRLWSLLLAISLLIGIVLPARADGIILPPEPPPCREMDCPPRPISQVTVKYHHVTVKIADQLAVTHVDQVFFNPNNWTVEGTYLFPLPQGAVVSGFTLWVDGKPVQGEVLSAEQARQVYEETVRSLRDPALLEYEGRGAVRASIFPIPPQGERRIELEYTQALTAENGLVRYSYPLNTEKFSQEPLKDVSVQVDIQDRQSIRAVYSPSHAVDVQKIDDHHAVAGYETQDVLPDSDFTLYYSVGESEAFHMFSYRDPNDAKDTDGFFLLLLAPKPEDNTAAIAKDVLLVLDRSGSMEGEKFSQVQAAANFILKHLNTEDRFYLLSFSSGMAAYAPDLRPATDAPKAETWIDGLSAAGSTDINRALLEASAVMDKERPTYLIFLTDGLPTQGVVDSQEIIKNFAQAAPPNLRLFAFGVGYDVDTVLLDTLSQEHHGLSTYVRPGESISEILSAFYERISTPVLTDLKLDFGAISTYDLYPSPLPDLFSGSQVVVVGRYKEGGTADVSLEGLVSGQAQAFHYPKQVFEPNNADNPGALKMLPRLWATRKIGYLLNQIRLNGPDKETIDQIVRLSIRYGIVTPYTSYLVTESMPLGEESQQDIANQALNAATNAPTVTSGKGAVDRAAQEGAMQGANSAPEVSGAEQQMLRTVGASTFVLSNGVWIDTRYDPKATPTQKIGFLSAAYFDLLKAHPELAPALALGEQVIVMVGDQAYQVVPQGAAGDKTPPGEKTPPGPTATPNDQAGTPRAKITGTPGEVALVATPIPVADSRTKRPEQSPVCGGLFIPVAAAIGLIFLKRKQAG